MHSPEFSLRSGHPLYHTLAIDFSALVALTTLGVNKHELECVTVGNTASAIEQQCGLASSALYASRNNPTL